MKKNYTKKLILIATILLFLGIAVRPITSLEIIRDNNIRSVEQVESSIVNCDCEVVDNEYPVYVEQKLHKMGVMVRFFSNRYGDIPEVKEKCNKILELLDSDRPICDLLQNMSWIFWFISIYFYYKAFDAYFAGHPYLMLIYGSIYCVFFVISSSLSKIYAILHCTDENFQIPSYLPLKIYRLKS